MKAVLGAMRDGGLFGMRDLRRSLSECTNINLPPLGAEIKQVV